MRRTIAVAHLIRPLNCIMIGFAVLVGMLVATRGKLGGYILPRAVLGFITGFTLLAAANTINDYHDRDIDKINEPNRPIPSGAVNPDESLLYVAMLSVVGFIAAFFTSPSNLIIAVAAWLLLIYYATRGKRTGILGNFVVSACIALPFIYGGVAVETELSELSLVILFAILAFFSTLGREVTKGIADVPGDRAQGVKTAAVLYGAKNASSIAIIFYLAAVALSVLPLLLHVSLWYLPFVVAADIGFLFSAISLFQDFSRNNARKVKSLARVWMVLGMLAFVAGTLTSG